MNDYYLPEYLKSHKNKAVNPKERYDITDERYFIPNHIVDLSLADLLNYPYLDISNGSLLSVCSSEEYWDTHCRNNIIVSRTEYCFHSTTFEQIKTASPYIHSTYGMSANALVELANILRLHEGIENHSYVRICPELIFSFSKEMRDEIGNLDTQDIEGLAQDWQKAVLAFYEVDNTKNVRKFWFGWITVYEHSHYTKEYFTDLLLNIHELVRSCEEQETIFISVDY